MKKRISGSDVLNRFFTVVLLSLVFWPGRSLLAAGSFTVTTTNDAHSQGFSSQGSPGSTSATTDGTQISLRSALEYASTVGGTNIINLPSGTYNLSLGGDLVAGVKTNTIIYIHGQSSPGDTIIHQSQSNRMVFSIDYNVTSNVVFSLDNVTVSGGNEDNSDPDGYGGTGGAVLSGGGSSASGNAVNFTNVVFAGNHTIGNGPGGAVIMSGGGDLNIVNCVFTNNQSGVSGNGAGGAVYFDNFGNDGNVVITGSVFLNNVANGNFGGGQGGAVYLSGAGGVFTLTGNTFVSNSCPSSGSALGGAIYLHTGTLTANYNRFFENQASNGASGVYIAGNESSTGDLRNNWWGGNDGPNATNSDTTFPTNSSATPLSDGQIAFDPWLELQCAPNPNPILVGGSTTFTASFLTNSDGDAISSSNLSVLAGLPVTFSNAQDGSLSDVQASIQSSGTATATYTANSDGIDAVNATVDNATVTASITNNQAAAFTSAGSTNFLPDAFGSIIITASGFPAPTLSESGGDVLPGGVLFNPVTGNLSGTPADGAGGNYTLHFTAHNGIGGDATQTFTLEVGQPAAITSVNQATFTAAGTNNFTVTATGFPSPTFSETGELPSGVALNSTNGILGGTPAFGTGGIYPLTLTAHNGVGIDATQSFTLTVNEAPIVSCPGNIITNAANGVCLLPSISFAANATGFPVPGITYQLNASTITSLTTFPLGTNTVTCTASNSVGTNSCSFTVTVLPGTAPHLNIIHSGANLVVSWPTNYSCYALQSASALSSNRWSNYSGLLATNGGNFFATNSVSITNQFFRLTH